MTVLSGREGMCGGQEAGGRRNKRYFTLIVSSTSCKIFQHYITCTGVQVFKHLPVGWLLTFVTSDSVVEGFVVVLVGITASTVVVKEESVAAIHNQNMVHTLLTLYVYLHVKFILYMQAR